HGGAATAAENGPRVAAAVDEDEGLGFVGEAFEEPGVKGGADGAGLMGLLEVFAEIDDFDAGERTGGHTGSERDELVFDGLRGVVGFERRRSGAEKRDGVFEFGADDGGVAAVILGRFFLLVTILL